MSDNSNKKEKHMVAKVDKFGISVASKKQLKFSAWFRKVSTTKEDAKGNRFATVPLNAFSFQGTNEEQEYFLGRLFVNEIIRENFLGLTPGQISACNSFCREILSKPVLERIRKHNSPIEALYILGGSELLRDYGLNISDNEDNHESICKKYEIPETCNPLTRDEKNNINRGITAACNLWTTTFENRQKLNIFFDENADPNNSYPSQKGVLAFASSCAMTGAMEYDAMPSFAYEVPVASNQMFNILTVKLQSDRNLATEISDSVLNGKLESIFSGVYLDDLQEMIKDERFSVDEFPLRKPIDRYPFYKTISEIKKTPTQEDCSPEDFREFSKCCSYVLGTSHQIYSNVQKSLAERPHSEVISAVLYGCMYESGTTLPIVPGKSKRSSFVTGDGLQIRIPISTDVKGTPTVVKGVAVSHNYCKKLLGTPADVMKKKYPLRKIVDAFPSKLTREESDPQISQFPEEKPDKVFAVSLTTAPPSEAKVNLVDEENKNNFREMMEAIGKKMHPTSLIKRTKESIDQFHKVKRKAARGAIHTVVRVMSPFLTNEEVESLTDCLSQMGDFPDKGSNAESEMRSCVPERNPLEIIKNSKMNNGFQ